MVEWLSETDKHPLRPDVPFFRHLTWTELHAALLGAPFGLMVYWSQVLGRSGVAFGLAVTIAQLILGEGQRRSKRSKCEHRIGKHDIEQEPWYFSTAGVAAWIVSTVVGGVL